MILLEFIFKVSLVLGYISNELLLSLMSIYRS